MVRFVWSLLPGFSARGVLKGGAIGVDRTSGRVSSQNRKIHVFLLKGNGILIKKSLKATIIHSDK